MLFAALLSITVAPFLMTLLIRGRIPPEEKNPINRLLIWLYHPFARLALAVSLPHGAAGGGGDRGHLADLPSLGSEFMPPLWEESLLYMPATLPGASIDTMRAGDPGAGPHPDDVPRGGQRVRQGRPGRTATDPSPLEMVETIINLKPPDQWRPGMTPDRLIAEMDAALKRKPSASARAGPCRSRAASTCSRPASARRSASRFSGPALEEIARLGREIETALGTVPGTRRRFRRTRLGGVLSRLRRPSRQHRPLRPDG